MTGYAAMGRIEGGRVRALACAGARTVLDEDVRADAPRPEERPIVVDAAPGPDLGERWGRLRDQLVMTTFYLTDADSWR